LHFPDEPNWIGDWLAYCYHGKTRCAHLESANESAPITFTASEGHGLDFAIYPNFRLPIKFGLWQVFAGLAMGNALAPVTFSLDVSLFPR
jgi:hypothetical protein